MYIGDIYLPILSNIDKKSVSKITKEIAGINAKEPRTVSIRRNLQPITLEGYLYNDGEKDDAQYAEDVEALQYRSAGYCYTKYADLDGFIEIENAEAPQTSEELGVRNYSVEGKYLPASKYERVVEVETEMRENEFNIEFPPHVALPVGATNVRVKTSQDSVKLSAPAFMAGDIPIYRPFPAFYPDDVTHSTGDTPKYDTTAYKMSYNLLDAKDESISYTFVSGVDVPLGSYRVVLRMKEDTTIASDARIVVLSGDNVVVDSLHTLVGDGVWNIVKSASFNITQRGITYTIMVSKAEADVANLAVNYGFLLPEKRARVAFDVAAEYDVGECKVFDTITTDSEESTWIQVFNPEHDFAGDIVVQNSMFRWVIKQTAWKDATKVYNISGSAPVEIGKLYNKAFGDDSVAIKFKEIKPNYLKFTFELDTGNATSESTSAKENDTVEITPFNVVIDKDVIGAYKDHYTFESTPGVNVEYENGIIAGIDSNSVYGLIKSVDVTSSYDGDIIETTGSESSDSYVVPFVIPCEITSYLYKQAADLVISKDNGDVERKFWKDDFSVDSSENWVASVGTVTVDTVNKKLVYSGVTPGEGWYTLAPANAPVSPRKVSFICNIDPENVNNTSYRYIRFYIGSVYIGEFRRQNNSTEYYYRFNEGSCTYIGGFDFGVFGAYAPDTHVEFVIGEDNIIYGYLNGVLKIKGAVRSGIDLSGAFNFRVRVSNFPSVNFEFKEVTVSPSISYADDFTTDTVSGTNGRYVMVWGSQDITSSITHDTDHIVIPFAPDSLGNHRVFTLKSYKFTEGEFYFEITPPATSTGGERYGMLINGSAVGGTDPGDLIEMLYTGGKWYAQFTTRKHAWDQTPDVSEELIGFTGGVPTKFKIQLDPDHGVGYASIWQGVSEPTYPTLKFYYVSKIDGYPFRLVLRNLTESTCNLSNIKIRAESIVGRTNVEVTEPFWFRDEFGEDSIGRYSVPGNMTVSEGVVAFSSVGYYGILPSAKMTDEFTVSVDVNLASNSRSWILFGNALPKSGRYANTDGVTKYLIWVQSAGDRLELKGYGSYSGSRNWTNVGLSTTEPNTISLNVSGTTLTITVNGTPLTPYTLSVAPSGYVGIGKYSGAVSFDNLQISGTRVYQKPIHRGVMLGLYSTS